MFELLITAIAVVFIFMSAIQLEERFSVPTPVGILSLAIGLYTLAPNVLVMPANETDFAKLVLLLLPLLILSDTMQLNLQELKENAISLFYLAFVAIALSIGLGYFVAGTFLSEYNLSLGAIIFLFAATLATDPVAVVSIFSKFKLPHRLKILAEGESLFNDATAVIAVAYIAIPLLTGHTLTVVGTTLTGLMVIVGSILLGVAIGFVGLFFMGTRQHKHIELASILLTAMFSLLIAENFYVILEFIGIHTHFHLSGLLTIIVSILTLYHVVNKLVKEAELAMNQTSESLEGFKTTEKLLFHQTLTSFKSNIINKERHLEIKDTIQLMALIANTILFVYLGEIMGLDLGIMLSYWKEILIMFTATTLIRAVMMGKFAFISNKTTKMTNINFRWWAVLTFAGFKGSLSIVLLTMLPADFEHLEMFRAVVVGVIAMSTFLYAAGLVIVIKSNQEIFEKEYREEHSH